MYRSSCRRAWVRDMLVLGALVRGFWELEVELKTEVVCRGWSVAV